MSRKERKIKPVSFTIEDEYDYALLEFVERVNPSTKKTKVFSKYVKRLIEADMKRENRGLAHHIEDVDIEHDEEEYSIETKEAMSSFF